MADSFSSFDAFKQEVAQRTRRALMEQQAASQPAPRGMDSLVKGAVMSAPQVDAALTGSPRRPKGVSSLSSVSKGSLSSDHVSVTDKIPERLRYTPRKGKEEDREEKQQVENKRPASAPVSKRLLRLAPTKGRTVNLYPNDGHYNKQAPVHIVLPENMDLLLDMGQQRLNLPGAAWCVFRCSDGSQVKNIDEVDDEENLVVAVKEAFKPQVDVTRRPRPAPPVQYTRSLRAKIESTLNSPGLLSGGSPSAEVRSLLQDTGKLLRRYRLSYNTGLQKDHCIQVDAPRSLLNVRILCGLGAVSLRNQSLASLEGMQLQPDMAELFLQNNMLSDLDHFIPQPKLKELRLENNVIISFKGFSTQPKLESIWLEPNPICMHPNYRLMVAIAQNNNYLVRIDDQLIDREDRLLARALAPYVGDALRAGWLLDTEPSPDADLDMTVEEFRHFHASPHPQYPVG
eukprot:CAMPEP_0114120962 /NCGR_PEP_ID=MMETSP0043_2-20121206/6931_1 /TAXON_ID=464988 /ORGANISM="Hemiselmis andersenii, Strain CCMP644" /LENGTH=455 /DNA_ID=CAMNT_0001213625 /DNA_START=259 /DNA_END=1623 /DNA_ORIENTATION=+